MEADSTTRSDDSEDELFSYLNKKAKVRQKVIQKKDSESVNILEKKNTVTVPVKEPLMVTNQKTVNNDKEVTVIPHKQKSPKQIHSNKTKKNITTDLKDTKKRVKDLPDLEASNVTGTNSYNEHTESKRLGQSSIGCNTDIDTAIDLTDINKQIKLLVNKSRKGKAGKTEGTITKSDTIKVLSTKISNVNKTNQVTELDVFEPESESEEICVALRQDETSQSLNRFQICNSRDQHEDESNPAINLERNDIIHVRGSYSYSSPVNLEVSLIEQDVSPLHSPRDAANRSTGSQQQVGETNQAFVPNLDEGRVHVPIQYKFVRDGNKLARVAVIQQQSVHQPTNAVEFDGLYDHPNLSEMKVEMVGDHQTDHLILNSESNKQVDEINEDLDISDSNNDYEDLNISDSNNDYEDLNISDSNNNDSSDEPVHSDNLHEDIDPESENKNHCSPDIDLECVTDNVNLVKVTGDSAIFDQNTESTDIGQDCVIYNDDHVKVTDDSRCTITVQNTEIADTEQECVTDDYVEGKETDDSAIFDQNTENTGIGQDCVIYNDGLVKVTDDSRCTIAEQYTENTDTEFECVTDDNVEVKSTDDSTWTIAEQNTENSDSETNIVKKTDNDFMEYLEATCLSENASTCSQVSICSKESQIVLKVEADGKLTECTQCPASEGLVAKPDLREAKTEMDINFLTMRIMKLENEVLEMKKTNVSDGGENKPDGLNEKPDKVVDGLSPRVSDTHHSVITLTSPDYQGEKANTVNSRNDTECDIIAIEAKSAGKPTDEPKGRDGIDKDIENNGSGKVSRGRKRQKTADSNTDSVQPKHKVSKLGGDTTNSANARGRKKRSVNDSESLALARAARIISGSSGKPVQGRQSTSCKPVQGRQSTSGKSAQGQQSTSAKSAQGYQSTSAKSAQGHQSTSGKPAQGQQSTSDKPAQGQQSTSVKNVRMNKPVTSTGTRQGISVSTKSASVFDDEKTGAVQMELSSFSESDRSFTGDKCMNVDEYTAYDEDFLKNLFEQKMKEVKLIQTALKQKKKDKTKKVKAKKVIKSKKLTNSKLNTGDKPESTLTEDIENTIVAQKKKKSCQSVKSPTKQKINTDTKSSPRSNKDNSKGKMVNKSEYEAKPSLNLGKKPGRVKTSRSKVNKKVTWDERESELLGDPSDTEYLTNMDDTTRQIIQARKQSKQIKNEHDSGKERMSNLRKSGRKTMPNIKYNVFETLKSERTEENALEGGKTENSAGKVKGDLNVSDLLRKGRKRKSPTVCKYVNESERTSHTLEHCVDESGSSVCDSGQVKERGVNTDTVTHSPQKVENMESKRQRLEAVISVKLKHHSDAETKTKGGEKKTSHRRKNTSKERKQSNSVHNKKLNTGKLKASKVTKSKEKMQDKTQLPTQSTAKNRKTHKSVNDTVVESDSEKVRKKGRKPKASQQKSTKTKMVGQVNPSRVAFEKSYDYSWKDKLGANAFSFNFKKLHEQRKPLNVKKMIKQIIVSNDTSEKKTSHKSAKHRRRHRELKHDDSEAAITLTSDSDDAWLSDSSVAFPGIKLGDAGLAHHVHRLCEVGVAMETKQKQTVHRDVSKSGDIEQESLASTSQVKTQQDNERVEHDIQDMVAPDNSTETTVIKMTESSTLEHNIVIDESDKYNSDQNLSKTKVENKPSKVSYPDVNNVEGRSLPITNNTEHNQTVHSQNVTEVNKVPENVIKSHECEQESVTENSPTVFDTITLKDKANVTKDENVRKTQVIKTKHIEKKTIEFHCSPSKTTEQLDIQTGMTSNHTDSDNKKVFSISQACPVSPKVSKTFTQIKSLLVRREKKFPGSTVIQNLQFTSD